MLLRRKIPSESDASAQASANGDAAQEKSESELEDCQRLCASGSGVSSKPKMKTNFFKSLREHWRKRKTKLAVQNGVDVSSGPPEPGSRKRDVTVYCPGSSSLAASNSHGDSPNDANDNYVRAGVGSNGERVCSDAVGETSHHDLPSSSSFTVPSVHVYQPESSIVEGPQVPSRQPLLDATPSGFVSVFPGPDGREDLRISSLSEELFKLSKHGWYWGPITRGEAEEKLADQPDGAFLVRDSSDDRYLLSLTFKSYGKTLHTRIEHCNGLFSFYAQSGPEGRACIVDLIQESMNYSQSGVFCYSRGRSPGVPSFPVRLIKPVSRLTHVRSLQYLCRFVIRQYTRFDHIQRLPLPSRIKGYLEEGHY
nr:LOW QUALITY PROTEIN: suppressor of cytokine signaling 6-like [Rhipicephalus microplus]